MKKKFKEWFDRYKYPELLCSSAAILAAQLHHSIGNSVLTAYVITSAEYLAFYGTVFYISYKQLRKENNKSNKPTTRRDIYVLLRNLILEFGYPALLDFFIVRPFFMYTMPEVLHNRVLGVIAGKIMADICFYIPTIFNYELIKRKKSRLEKHQQQ